MRRFFYFAIFLASFGAGLFIHEASRNREVFRTICDLTETHFYKDNEGVQKWLVDCRRKAAFVSWKLNKTQLMDQIQDHMNQLNVSHFLVYTPAEDKKLWQGRAVDTGIRSRYVEDHLIVYKVIKGSAAEAAGVRAGDELIEIVGASQVTPWGAQNRSGSFKFLRNSETFDAEILATELTLSDQPRLTRLNSRTTLLEIPSFRSEFFDADSWMKVVGGLDAVDHVIIDIRENAGGNFVAMLRALSTFTCGPQSVGTLVQPRRGGDDKEAFDDDTGDLYQIAELERYRSLGLYTFANYGCYRGKVTILIGPDTSSVAEIFANAFFMRERSRVWGQPTAGDVVLAVWYDLPMLGPGYSISIPEAVFLTPDQEELENRGVAPQKEIFYDLRLSRAGKDTFIEAALR